MIAYIHNKFKNFYRQRTSFLEAEQKVDTHKQVADHSYKYKNLDSPRNGGYSVQKNMVPVTAHPKSVYDSNNDYVYKSIRTSPR